MKRAPVEVFAETPFDILVVGGGIYGMMAARDAALRGLRTALVEQADFGGATSGNSLKLMHGGIRYVQHLDFPRIRASARERAFWLRAAPSIVRPLEFTIPLLGHGIKGPEAFAAAAQIYNLASSGLRGPNVSGARVVGPSEARRRLGTFAPERLTGGGVWQDGQIQDLGRLHMACLRAGVEAGAVAANYMSASRLIAEGGRVVGAAIEDRLTGATGTVRAKVTLCCAGAAGRGLVAPLTGEETGLPGLLRATNIVVARDIGARGLGVISHARADAVVDRGGRMYFFTPWKGRAILGTHEAALPDVPSNEPVRSDADVAEFLTALAKVCPGLELGRDDVLHVHQGLIPAAVDDDRGSPKRLTRGTLIDHADSGLGGLITVSGVKYTTARLVAEQAVDRAVRQLGRAVPPSRSAEIALPVDTAGDPDPRDLASVSARIRSAVDHEMAVTLEDVVLRRTSWGETGVAQRDPAAARTIAHAAELSGLRRALPLSAA